MSQSGGEMKRPGVQEAKGLGCSFGKGRCLQGFLPTSVWPEFCHMAISGDKGSRRRGIF